MKGNIFEKQYAGGGKSKYAGIKDGLYVVAAKTTQNSNPGRIVGAWLFTPGLLAQMGNPKRVWMVKGGNGLIGFRPCLINHPNSYTIQTSKRSMGRITCSNILRTLPHVRGKSVYEATVDEDGDVVIDTFRPLKLENINYSED